MPFGSFVDLTSSIIRWRPKRGKLCTVVEKGISNPSTALKVAANPRQIGRFYAHLLDSGSGRGRECEAVFAGSGKVSSPEPVRLSTVPKGTLVAEVFA